MDTKRIRVVLELTDPEGRERLMALCEQFDLTPEQVVQGALDFFIETVEEKTKGFHVGSVPEDAIVGVGGIQKILSLPQLQQ